MSFKGKLLKIGIDTDALAALSTVEMTALDGITAGTVTASKALIVDANKDLATIRNVTVSGNIVHGSTTLSESDTAKIDGITAGTAIASKAVVLDASKDVTGINSLTATTIVATTLTQTNIDAGASGTPGSVDIFPTTAANGKVIISAVDNGGARNVTITNAAHGQSSVYSIPDGGQATANFVISESAQTIAGALTLSGGILTDDIDAATATALDIGAATATSVTLGASDANTTVNGDLVVAGGDIDLGSSGVAGTIDVFPTTAANGKLIISCTDQGGARNTTLNANAITQSQVVNIPDYNAAATYIVSTSAALSLAEADVLQGATAGTQVASKVIVTDANINQGIAKATELHIGLTGAEVQINATPAEINRACDLSARLVAISDSASITEVAHEGRDMYVTGADLGTYTLPEATGSGGRYRFIIGEVNTSNNVFVVADTTNCNFIGNIINQDADLVGTIAAIIYPAPANADTITLNGTSTGGQLGDWIELVDVATDVWFVNGVVSCPAGSNTATPFSAAV